MAGSLPGEALYLQYDHMATQEPSVKNKICTQSLGVLKYYAILLGEEGGTEDHNHKGGRGAMQRKILKEGTLKRNDYCQDQLSMSGSRVDIFTYQN